MSGTNSPQSTNLLIVGLSIVPTKTILYFMRNYFTITIYDVFLYNPYWQWTVFSYVSF